MQDLINSKVLRKEIKRICKEELEKIVPKGQVNALWKHLNKTNERIRCLEERLSSSLVKSCLKEGGGGI